MTAAFGQLPEADFCFPGGGRGVQLFRDRPVCGERFGGIARGEPGPPCVREKLGPEERVQGRGGGRLVGGRGLLGPQRVLVGRTEQGVALRSEVLVGLGSGPLEDVDRLLGLALRRRVCARRMLASWAAWVPEKFSTTCDNTLAASG